MSNSVTVHSKQIASFNTLTVEAGTNCPQGGDSGHGGRTVFRLSNGCGDMRISVDGRKIEGAERIEIILGGDSEAQTFVNALEFAADILRAQMGDGVEGID